MSSTFNSLSDLFNEVYGDMLIDSMDEKNAALYRLLTKYAAVNDVKLGLGPEFYETEQDIDPEEAW